MNHPFDLADLNPTLLLAAVTGEEEDGATVEEILYSREVDAVFFAIAEALGLIPFEPGVDG